MKAKKNTIIKTAKKVIEKSIIKTSKQSTEKNKYSRKKTVEKGHKIFLASSMRMLDNKKGFTNINKAIAEGIKELNAGSAKTIYGVLQNKHHNEDLDYSKIVCVFQLRGNKCDNEGNLVVGK